MSKILMSNKDYHAAEGISSSILKKIANSTLLHALSEEPKESKAFDIGSALHAIVLEPETFDSEFAVSPVFGDGRKPEVKKAKEEFAKTALGRTVINQAEFEEVRSMLESISNHPIASKMLSGGEAEYSYFSEEVISGSTVVLKARPDYVNAGALIDLKTTSKKASIDSFTRDCIEYGYHIQAAFYLDVYNKVTEQNLTDFFFVVVESRSPYDIAVYKMGEPEIILGREQYKSALEKLVKFHSSEDRNLKKFGYEAVVREIVFPQWALNKLESTILERGD